MPLRENADLLKQQYHQAAERAQNGGNFIWACRIIPLATSYNSEAFAVEQAAAKEHHDAVRLAVSELIAEGYTEFLRTDT